MIAPRWHKVIRDLWSNKTKTILVVLAIAVGLFASGSVFITQEVLVQDMTGQYRAANPSSIVMTTSSFDSGLVRWLGQQPDVVQVQGRANRGATLVVGKDTYNLILYAYDDSGEIDMNLVTTESGTWPPARRDIVFERRSIGLTKGEIGDSITVEMSDGKQHQLTIAGTVHDINAMPANMFPMPTGYVSLQTMQWLGLSATMNEVNIITRPEYTTIPQLEKVANNLKQKLQDRGVTIHSTLVRKPDDHWAKEVTESFTLILSAIGVFSLILSAFLVVNTVTALLAQQRRQIGVMKAVGGTHRQIISLYLVLVTFYGLLALFVALPISMVLGYAFTAMVANMLNIDIQNFHMPWSVFFIELGAAVLVPIIAASIPILGGVRVSVRETLSVQGIGSKRGGWFDRMLLHVKLLSRPMLLSLRNTFRRKARLALTLGTLILAGTLFISIMGVRASLMVDTQETFRKYYNWEVALYLDGTYAEQAVETRALRVPGVVAVESQDAVTVQRIKDDGSKGANFNLYGVSPTSKFLNPDIVSGRWLRPGDRNAVVLTSGLVNDMPDVKVGDRIKLSMKNTKEEWDVVGIIPMVWDKVGYTDFDYLSRLNGTNGQASQLYVSTTRTDAAFQNEMSKVLETQMKKAGVKVGGTMTRNAIAASMSSRNDFLITFLLIMAVMCAVIGGLGLMGLMSLNVLERTREIGVMRSIGASSGAVGGIVVVEGLLIGVISWLLAVPLSVPISLLFDTALGQILAGQPFIFIFSPLGLGVWLAIVCAISVVASLLPAYRAMRMSVRETLAYE